MAGENSNDPNLNNTSMPDDTIEVDERNTPDFWRRWIKSAEKASKAFWDRSAEAWAEYENQTCIDDEVPRAFPIYWSSCKTLEPAYYSRTPTITTQRRFEQKDEVALTASLIVERLGRYLVDECEFDAAMQASVQDFIHADKTCTQLLYDHDIKEVRYRCQAF